MDKILIVDDEEFNIDILNEYLTDAGYEVVIARDGVEALEQLEIHADIVVIVLDRMMPRMNGMQCLEKFRRDDRFRDIPVIMQTAAASAEQIVQGLEGGVYYYLTKPYEEGVLLSIVGAAVGESHLKAQLRGDLNGQRRALGLMEHARFRFRTLEDAHRLAVHVACCFPEPEIIVYGLSELLINAVEHGNLGIGYAEKTRLVHQGVWQDEVVRRLALPENADRWGYLTYAGTSERISLRIEDQGAGFDFKAYLELSPERATDPNGRGIATARILSFSEIEYLGRGNIVQCAVDLAPSAASAVHRPEFSNSERLAS